MYDIFDDTSNIAMLFCEVKGSELCWSFVQASMGRWSSKLDSNAFSWLSRSDVLKMDPRPFLWLRITRPIVVTEYGCQLGVKQVVGIYRPESVDALGIASFGRSPLLWDGSLG